MKTIQAHGNKLFCKRMFVWASALSFDFLNSGLMPARGMSLHLPSSVSHRMQHVNTIKENTMKLDVLTNHTVKAAIEALQKGDKNTWSALFTPDATMLDDGHPRNLKQFTQDALSHERFTSIDKIENNGLNLEGAFHSDTWGDFRTYFRFHLTADGKIRRLDVGQAD